MTTERLEKHFFKCNKCGCEELDVVRQFVRSTFREATLPCDCGKADVAAMRREREDELFEQTGPLDDCHHFDLDEPEQLDDLGSEQEEHEVECPSCAEDADETSWEIELLDEVEESDEEYFVRCHGTESWHKKGWLRPIPAKDVAQMLGCSLAEAEDLIVSGRLARHPKSRDLATDSFAFARYKEEVK